MILCLSGMKCLRQEATVDDPRFAIVSCHMYINFSVTLEVVDYGSGVSVKKQKENFLSKQKQCEIGDYQAFDIVFQPPIAIKANTRYQISATITGPPSWYGTNCCSTVKHSGVTFHFYVVSTPTNCEKGQFSKFVFTLD